MSDQILPGGAPDDALDALASAYLDDAATAAERARVESDPVLQSRVANFRAVRSRVADPVVVPVAAREAHMAAALAAFGAPEAADATVTSLTTARAAKRSRILAPLAAAAAVGVLLVGVGIAATRGDDDASTTADTAAAESAGTQLKVGADDAQAPAAQDQFSVAATTAAPATTAASARTATAGGSTEDAPVTMEAAAPFAAPVEVASNEELSSVVDDALDQDAAVTTMAPTNLDQAVCATEGELLMELVWQGIDAVLYVVPSIADPQEAVVYEVGTCVELVTLPLP